MTSDRRASWLKGVLDLLVLASLTAGENYGYEIVKDLAESGLGQIKGGTLYPVLNRLEEAGLVTAEFRATERGPGRRYYQLTDQGRQTLAEQGGLWLSFDESVRAALVRGGVEAPGPAPSRQREHEHQQEHEREGELR
ncbi:PadR family transcriptional regulator [Streptosporangium sp. NPDC002524]|uniref:PadR family transcriptional regulator n=1 Tax=Streptosporangium sp. NPDC002524 TaxID=3154537 RepID=UPI00331904E4